MAAMGKKAAIGKEGHSRHLQFTDLPDEILIRILSLLPSTKDAVRTCLLLFKRSEQQHLWKYLPSLVFPLGFMFDRDRHLIINFAERVMDLRDQSVPLVSFSLGFEMGIDNVDRFTKLITKVVQCNVQELTLSIDDSNYMDDDEMENTPYSCIFGCQSLEKLVLDMITFNVPSSAICLPRLKYLRLGGEVILEDEESTEKLLSSPLLEELIIDRCNWHDHSIQVCSPNLQVLKICDYKDEEPINIYLGEYQSARICIIGDSLKHFSYTGNLINEYCICASSSTQLSKVEMYVSEEIIEDLRFNCYKHLRGFPKTRNLALSDYFLEGLQNISELIDTIPLFECLTRLDIRVYKRRICIDSLVLMMIYERCPHLEYLNIGILSTTKENPQLSPMPLCFQTSLKKILVHYYVPGDDEADAAIDVLLNSAYVLEELVIYCSCKRDKDKDFHTIQELHDRLNRRPRVSKDCIISVRGEDYVKRPVSSCYYEDFYLKSMNES